MKLENEPQEKHLVLYVYVNIIDEFINSKWINKTIYSVKKQRTLQKQKLCYSNDFQNILWYYNYNLYIQQIKVSNTLYLFNCIGML